VRRRRMVHKSTGLARHDIVPVPSTLTMGKDLGWRAFDKLRPVFTHRTDRTEISLIPAPSVD
jgi:hypothetical protein